MMMQIIIAAFVPSLKLLEELTYPVDIGLYLVAVGNKVTEVGALDAVEAENRVTVGVWNGPVK